MEVTDAGHRHAGRVGLEANVADDFVLVGTLAVGHRPPAIAIAGAAKLESGLFASRARWNSENVGAPGIGGGGNVRLSDRLNANTFQGPAAALSTTPRMEIELVRGRLDDEDDGVRAGTHQREGAFVTVVFLGGDSEFAVGDGAEGKSCRARPWWSCCGDDAAEAPLKTRRAVRPTFRPAAGAPLFSSTVPPMPRRRGRSSSGGAPGLPIPGDCPVVSGGSDTAATRSCPRADAGAVDVGCDERVVDPGQSRRRAEPLLRRRERAAALRARIPRRQAARVSRGVRARGGTRPPALGFREWPLLFGSRP